MISVFFHTPSEMIVGDSKILTTKLTPILSLWKSLIKVDPLKYFHNNIEWEFDIQLIRWLKQGSQLLTSQEHEQVENVEQKPLSAFIKVESALAMRLVNTIHQSLSQINRSLKSNTPLQLSLMEAAVDIANLKVWNLLRMESFAISLFSFPIWNARLYFRYKRLKINPRIFLRGRICRQKTGLLVILLIIWFF